MSEPRYYTCGAFTCSDDGDMHERVTCVFDGRFTSRRRARVQVKAMARETLPRNVAPVIYLFNGPPNMAINAVETFLDALQRLTNSGLHLVSEVQL